MLPSASVAGVISSQKVAVIVPQPYRCVVSLARRILFRTWPPFIDFDGPGRHRLRRVRLELTRDLSPVLPVGRLRNVALTGGEIHPAVCASLSHLDTERGCQSRCAVSDQSQLATTASARGKPVASCQMVKLLQENLR